MLPGLTAPKPIVNDAHPKVMGFGAGKTIPKTTIGARLYPSYEEPGLRLLEIQTFRTGLQTPSSRKVQQKKIEFSHVSRISLFQSIINLPF